MGLLKRSKILLLVLGMAVTTSGCFKVSPSSKAVSGNGSAGGGDTDTGPSASYSFMSVTTMKSILVNNLGLPVDNPLILAGNGTLSGRSYTTEYASALGEGNPNFGIAPNHDPAPMKSKLALQIFSDGCVQGLQNTQVMNRLFPNGANNFDTLFLTFLGRLPNDSEKTILSDLVRRVSAQVAPAAACAAVLASIEALNES